MTSEQIELWPKVEEAESPKASTNVHFSSVHDIWSTPKDVYKTLDAEFGFDFDPCPLNPTFDGLQIEWGGVNFVNPPYSELAEWLKKSFQEYKKGKTVVLLIPSRTDTKAWHEYVMKSDGIRFIRGRLKFGNSTQPAPFPSCIVIFKGKI